MSCIGFPAASGICIDTFQQMGLAKKSDWLSSNPLFYAGRNKIIANSDPTIAEKHGETYGKSKRMKFFGRRKTIHWQKPKEQSESFPLFRFGVVSLLNVISKQQCLLLPGRDHLAMPRANNCSNTFTKHSKMICLSLCTHNPFMQGRAAEVDCFWNRGFLVSPQDVRSSEKSVSGLHLSSCILLGWWKVGGLGQLAKTSGGSWSPHAAG